MSLLLMEFAASFLFVLIGVGVSVISGSSVGVLGTALGFGVAMFAALSVFGGKLVTGNPALTLSLLCARRVSFKSFLLRIVGQFIGAFAGVYAVKLLVDASALGGSVVTGLAQNGYFMHSDIRMSMIMCFVAELLFMFFLSLSFIGGVKRGDNVGTFALVQSTVLFGFFLILIPVDGGGLNPARSLASNVLFGGEYLSQVWLFLAAPLVGATIAGLINMPKKVKVEEVEDDEDED